MPEATDFLSAASRICRHWPIHDWCYCFNARPKRVASIFDRHGFVSQAAILGFMAGGMARKFHDNMLKAVLLPQIAIVIGAIFLRYLDLF